MKNIRIVIAEDDAQIAELQKRFLERIEGCELVGMAHELSDARELVEVLQPDLLLLDIQFPSGNGLDFLGSLRDQKNPIDVILITATKEVAALKEALRNGVFDYILKPLTFQRLEEAIQNYANHFNKLHSLCNLAQSDVDRLLPRGIDARPAFGTSDQRLPKGIDCLTLIRVRKIIASANSSVCTEQVSEKIGASRTTARRYLEFLVSIHELEAEVTYGGVGRPQRHYSPIKLGIPSG